MVKLRSPLARHFAATSAPSTAAGQANVTIGEIAIAALYQLAGWPATFRQSAEPVLAALGLTGLGNYSEARTTDKCTAFRIAPDRLLIQSTSLGSWSEAAGLIDPSELVVLDLSHARTALSVGGTQSEHLMTRLVSINVAIERFAVGEFRQTGIHDIAVLIHRTAADTFVVYTPATWSGAVFDYITECARPLGPVIRSCPPEMAHGLITDP